MKTKTVKPKEKKAYKLTLTIGDETFKSTGATGAEALQTLERPKKIMAKGTMTVEFENLKKVIAMKPAQIKRLFLSTRGTLAVQAKYLFLYAK